MPKYIDKDNLLQLFRDSYCGCKAEIAKGRNELDTAFTGYNSCMSLAENMPTTDVQEVKHAKWVHYGEYCQCSNCEHVSDDIYYEGDMDSGYYIVLPHYCSNCGCKMEE